MDVVRFGRQIRALRRRRGWRQVDLAAAARVSRVTVWRVENGHADDVDIGAAERVAQAIGARLEMVLTWHGEGLDRILDRDHAAIVELVADVLRGLGWLVVPEASFAIRGERGSVDILAFHPESGIVLVVEVKSVVPDIQGTLLSFDRKTRLAPELARQRGWEPSGVGRVLVLAESRTNRRRVESHRATFDAAFPQRTAAVKRWLAQPAAAPPFSGLWFIAGSGASTGRQRVRRRSSPGPARRGGIVRCS